MFVCPQMVVYLPNYLPNNHKSAISFREEKPQLHLSYTIDIQIRSSQKCGSIAGLVSPQWQHSPREKVHQGSTTLEPKASKPPKSLFNTWVQGRTNTWYFNAPTAKNIKPWSNFSRLLVTPAGLGSQTPSYLTICYALLALGSEVGSQPWNDPWYSKW